MSCISCEGPIGRSCAERPCPLACCTEFCTDCIRARGVTNYRAMGFCSCLTVSLEHKLRVQFTDEHEGPAVVLGWQQRYGTKSEKPTRICVTLRWS